jgi:hypothetical protein
VTAMAALGPCVLWHGSKTRDGYGVLPGSDGKVAYAHRVSYERVRGPIPEGLVLDHLCGNPSCIAIDHLEAVTFAENCRRGGQAKLTLEIAQEIRRRYSAGELPGALGREFGVTKSAVRHIVRGRTWRA